MLGEKILSGETLWGGYSPSAVFALSLESGRRVFAKGSHPGQEAHGAQMLRQELDAYAALPFLSAPACLGRVAEAEEDGWHLGVFEYIETVPPLPWTEEKLAAVFAVLKTLHAQPRPPRLAHMHDTNFVSRFLSPEGGWTRLRDNRVSAERFLNLFARKDEGRRWLAENLEKLCALKAQVPPPRGPEGILHLDLRSDNILLAPCGRVYIVDWPNACFGPVAAELSYFLSAVSAEGGGDIGALLALYARVTGIKVPEDAFMHAIVSTTGFMADNAGRAVPVKLPRLRWMQGCILGAGLSFLAGIGVISPPPPPFTPA